MNIDFMNSFCLEPEGAMHNKIVNALLLLL